jgi:hypothetical protein
MLYHTFGVHSVQYVRSDFLTARRSFTVQFTPTKLSARFAEVAM